MLCHCVLYVVVDLPVLVQELKLIGAEWLRRRGLLQHRSHGCLSLWILSISRRDLFHRHEYLVDPGDVLLDFRYVVLQNGKFYSLC